MQETSDREFREYAAAALGEMGVPAIEPLIDAMASGRPGTAGFSFPGALPDRETRSGAAHPPAFAMPTRLSSSCATLTLWQMGETGLPAMVEKIAGKDK